MCLLMIFSIPSLYCISFIFACVTALKGNLLSKTMRIQLVTYMLSTFQPRVHLNQWESKIVMSVPHAVWLPPWSTGRMKWGMQSSVKSNFTLTTTSVPSPISFFYKWLCIYAILRARKEGMFFGKHVFVKLTDHNVKLILAAGYYQLWFSHSHHHRTTLAGFSIFPALRNGTGNKGLFYYSMIWILLDHHLPRFQSKVMCAKT